MDFAGSLGLEEGRYLLRRNPDEPTPDVDPDLAPELGRRVVVIQLLGAAPRRPRRLGRTLNLPPDAPTELELTRLTAVRSDRPLGAEEEAHQWMRSLQRDGKLREETVAEAMAAVNRTIHAFAVAQGEPYVSERAPDQAAAVRAGHGIGRDLANGRYTEAVAIETGSRARRGRRQATPGLSRVAALLGGRERADLSETFVLRARADFEAGRVREAAIGLASTVEAMMAELDRALADRDHEADMAALASHLEPARARARAALFGPLTDSEPAPTSELLELCERILRRRRLLRG